MRTSAYWRARRKIHYGTEQGEWRRWGHGERVKEKSERGRKEVEGVGEGKGAEVERERKRDRQADWQTGRQEDRHFGWYNFKSSWWLLRCRGVRNSHQRSEQNLDEVLWYKWSSHSVTIILKSEQLWLCTQERFTRPVQMKLTSRRGRWNEFQVTPSCPTQLHTSQL